MGFDHTKHKRNCVYYCIKCKTNIKTLNFINVQYFKIGGK